MLTKLGKYEIRRELGRGAMGIVYEGFDPFIERIVAIKTIQKSLIDQSEAQDALNRFRREAQASGRLTHPNIVSIYEYGEEGDMAFIAMEFITGKELKDYFDKAQRFQIKDSVHIMLQLLDALEYSHEHGVVHRDIKPSNIIITRGNQIKVVDFGIARIESSDLTQVGMVLGTPAYMSPEQFKGLVADRRSDLYSTGVILYQFLTGVRPFIGNPTVLMHKVLSQAPVRPSELNPEVSERLENVVKKAMSKEAEDRFQTAAEFKQALSKATGFASDSSGKMVDTDATLVVLKTANTAPPASAETDATLLVPKTPQNAQQSDNSSSPEINFDLGALSTNIEKQLEEVRKSASSETSDSELSGFDPMPVSSPPPQTARNDESESSLIVRLAREAEEKQEAKQSMSQTTANQQAPGQRLHQTLGRISGFLNSLAQHVKKAAPSVNRSYNFGRATVYTKLTCLDAHSDSRKLDLSEAALLDYIFISIRLSAPAPVVISRPRDMLDMLKGQLGKLKLRALDDLEELGKGPQEDWVQVRLSPDFPVQIQFKGNYAEGCIDVHTLNLEAFGSVSFKLEVGDVTQELMDGIGFFLLGRADKLPEALRRVGSMKNRI